MQTSLGKRKADGTESIAAKPPTVGAKRVCQTDVKEDLPECVTYDASCVPKDRHDELLARLLEEVMVQQGTVRTRVGPKPEPRLSAWCARDPASASYTYSGKRNVAQPLTPVLRELLELVEHTLGETFDGVLVNVYRDGKDSISYHSDDEKNIDTTGIASLSLGAKRRFLLRDKQDHSRRWEFSLGGGDLLHMRAPCQELYEHSVPKQASVTDMRVNLTFRRLKRQ